ncbi:MAG: exodeoxyribonuclease III [Candidatus Neomarinimicrobiota bacterium]
MRLYSWNVNGIRAAERKEFLTWLEQTDPDIVCLQETKANQAQLSSALLQDHGYFTYWHSAEKAGYSGVSTFCKKEPQYIQKGLGIKRFDQEGRVLITEHDRFLLYNIYFPNGQKDETRLKYKLDFYDELLPIINEQVESGLNVIVTGDWNTAHKEMDLARPKANQKTSGFLPVERKKLDLYISHGWVDTFRLLHPEPEQYSWWSYRFGARERNVGWRIDYFFMNEGFTEEIEEAGIHADIMGSDHCPISLTLKER